jgi:hypothetical protein
MYKAMGGGWVQKADQLTMPAGESQREAKAGTPPGK